jgi:two-component system sensor histidine kinase/response regulator
MSRRILVVEDSRTQAERLRLVLAGEGYEVDVASDGREGLAKARASAPDLVISDVTMPELDGFEFCRAMKSSDGINLIPIILLTTRTSPTDIMHGLESGADNFIPKTNDDEYLLERVRRIFLELEHRKQHHLGMEVNLTLGGRRITVTADRQQIMELLFSTFEEMGRHHDELARANQELQQARAEAERANCAKSQFLSRMSHELRTPLNAVMGFGQLLELAPLEPQELESAHLIVAAGRHLLDLINEVLDIGRIDAGELDLSLEPVRVGGVIEEAVDLTQLLAVERNVEVSGDFAGELHVIADRTRLKQVILNLLSNAIKYNRPGGAVTLGCQEADDGWSRIEVTDTGPGIAPENLDRLFAPFDRIDAERDTAVGGTGLGLALSKRLVEAMGGTLSVKSEVARGSTFWLQLPPADDPQGAGAEQAAPTPAAHAPETRRGASRPG